MVEELLERLKNAVGDNPPEDWSSWYSLCQDSIQVIEELQSDLEDAKSKK